MISGFQLLMGVLVGVLVVMGLLVFDASYTQENNLPTDPQFHTTFSLINKSLGDVQDISGGLENKVQGGSNVQAGLTDAPKSSLEAGVLFATRFPTLVKDMLQAVADIIGLPSWLIGAIITIFIITIMFVTIAFLRGREY